MRKKIKTLGSLAIICLSFAFVFSQAFASGNSGTGFESENFSGVSIERELFQDNLNCKNVYNDFFVSGNTGENFSDFGLGLSEVSSGDVSVMGEFENLANENESEIDLAGDLDDLEAANDCTGAFSTNEAFVNAELETELQNHNDADFNNDVEVCANTGENSSCFNTGFCDDCDLSFGSCNACGLSGFGDSETGDAISQIKIENAANSNKTEIDSGLFGGDIEAINSSTGFDSLNIAKVDLENETEVYNSNWADFDNDIFTSSNTGLNSDNANTGGGLGYETGDALNQIVLENTANVNNTEVVNNGIGDIAVGNQGTGACSDNLAEANVENEVEVNSYNNADIDNDVATISNTGGNSSDMSNFGCEGGCGEGIETGDALTSVSIVNVANSNETVVVTENPTEVEAINSCTGAGSENVAVVNVENSVDVVNQNYADINNNVVVQSNTGGNSSDYNNGGSGIATGSASVVFKIENGANKNVAEVSN